MSTLVPAPPGAGGEATTTPSRPQPSASLTRDAIAGLVVAAALVALVFLTSSSIDQTVTSENTWSQIAITFLGAGACAAAVLVGGRGRAWGAPAVAWFAAFTAFAALSILWSVQPDWSWFGANQLLSYLAAFAAAVVAGRLIPTRWPALVGGVALAVTVLCAYSLLAKVFPSTLASGNDYGRLLAPFGYWNAIGVAAALGLAPALWAATRPVSATVLRGLTVPAMTLMIAVIALSYSRSAALVGVVAVAAWVGFVPLRLRSALMLGLAGVCAIPIVVVALNDHNLTTDHVSMAAQDAAGHAFGPALLGITLVAALLGVAASMSMARVTVPEPTRRRIGTALLCVAALVPVAAVVAVAASSRGLFGQISHAWHSLVSTNSVVYDTPGRLTQLGSSRPAYWHQGLDVGSHALLKGVGELGYGVARLRYTTSGQKTDQAHNYLVQTFADLGLIGVVLTLGLLVAWGRAAARPLALKRKWSELTELEANERAGLAALAIVVITFGIQSVLDFTFYFPGIAIPVLVCAGWLAGRGPLSAPVGRRAQGRVSVLQRPGAGALVTGLAAIAMIGGWLMWQPLRSAQAMADAENHPDTAFASARAAASRDPLSIEPLDQLSALYSGNRQYAAARAELVKATQLQPENPQSWLSLGEYDYSAAHPLPAIAELQQALSLDRASSVDTITARTEIADANALLAQRRAAAKARSARARARARRHRGG
ncbi:MAG TPA: O-antigen ligase family protein [Solirubrobacteraceae bacterium]|nr:O-antigen ligase family protein [Solirubrobacteraceae bacterium]